MHLRGRFDNKLLSYSSLVWLWLLLVNTDDTWAVLPLPALPVDLFKFPGVKNSHYHTSMTNFWLLGIWKDQLATPEVATLLKRRRCLPGEVTTKQVMNKTTACCRNVHVSAQFYWISLKNLYNMLLYRSWWIFSITKSWILRILDENRPNFNFLPKILRICDFDGVLANCERKWLL